MPCHHARQLMRQGFYVHARSELDQLVCSGNLSSALLAEAYSLSCLNYLQLDDYAAATRCGEMALRLAEENRLQALVTMTHFRMGNALTYLYDAPAAIDHLEHFLADAANCAEAEELIPRAHIDLATNKVRQHGYAEAISHYQTAADGFKTLGHSDCQARALHGVVWCLLHMQRARQAEPYLQALAEYAGHHQTDAYMRNALIVDKAMLHRVREELHDSMTYCREILDRAPSAVAPEHLAEAAWVAGANTLDLGYLDLAAVFAAQALEQAITAQWCYMINRANQLRCRVATTKERRAT